MVIPLNSRRNLESAGQGSVKPLLRFGDGDAEIYMKASYKSLMNAWLRLCREKRQEAYTEQLLPNWEQSSRSKKGQGPKDSVQPEGRKLTRGSLIPRAWSQRQWKGFDLRTMPKRYTLKLDTFRFKVKEYTTQTVSIRKP